jgi:hypothetical protein
MFVAHLTNNSHLMVPGFFLAEFIFNFVVHNVIFVCRRVIALICLVIPLPANLVGHDAEHLDIIGYFGVFLEHSLRFGREFAGGATVRNKGGKRGEPWRALRGTGRHRTITPIAGRFNVDRRITVQRLDEGGIGDASGELARNSNLSGKGINHAPGTVEVAGQWMSEGSLKERGLAHRFFGF